MFKFSSFTDWLQGKSKKITIVKSSPVVEVIPSSNVRIVTQSKRIKTNSFRKKVLRGTVLKRSIIVSNPTVALKKPVVLAPIVLAKPVPAIPKTVLPPVPLAKIVEEKPTVLNPFIYPYKMDSEAGILLSQSLNAKKVFENGNYIHRSNHLVINYGNKRIPNWARGKINILNHWDKISVSSNKLEAFQILQESGVRIPDFTKEKKKAIEWVNAGLKVMCRTILNGYSGHGIVVATQSKEIVDAPLYSLYKPNAGEYRVIVVNGVVVDFMQKKRKLDFEESTGEKVNPLVRNHSNGWIFARNEVSPPKDVLDEAIKAVNALGLNFAGVDVLFNKKESKAYVLECNTAIGLTPEGTTLKRLTDAFNSICKNETPKSLV